MHEQSPTVFRPDRTHIFAAILMLLIGLVGAGTKPLYLGWLLLFPVAYIYVTLRSRTVVDDTGIHTRYGWKKPGTVSWEDFSGIGFRGAKAFASTTSGDEIVLPAISFNSLPQLAVASNGRIPDALTAGREAADEKIVVIHKDGRQVLMSKEEYAATHPEDDSANAATSAPDRGKDRPEKA